jgi:hypothetical protein
MSPAVYPVFGYFTWTELFVIAGIVGLICLPVFKGGDSSGGDSSDGDSGSDSGGGGDGGGGGD